MRKKSIFLLGLGGLGLLGIFLLGWFLNRDMKAQELLAQPTATNLPSCYSRYAKNYQKILAQFVERDKSITYTLLEVALKGEQTDNPVMNRLIFSENLYGRCQLLNENDKESSLLAWVPESVAVNFERQAYEKKIRQYGRNRFQQEVLATPTNIDESTWPEIGFFFPEHVMALQSLGIQLPKGILIIERTCELVRLNPFNRQKLKDPKFIAEFKRSCPPLQRFRKDS
jgi:hypothetical protein